VPATTADVMLVLPWKYLIFQLDEGALSLKRSLFEPSFWMLTAKMYCSPKPNDVP